MLTSTIDISDRDGVVIAENLILISLAFHWLTLIVTYSPSVHKLKEKVNKTLPIGRVEQ